MHNWHIAWLVRSGLERHSMGLSVSSYFIIQYVLNLNQYRLMNKEYHNFRFNTNNSFALICVKFGNTLS